MPHILDHPLKSINILHVKVFHNLSPLITIYNRPHNIIKYTPHRIRLYRRPRGLKYLITMAQHFVLIYKCVNFEVL